LTCSVCSLYFSNEGGLKSAPETPAISSAITAMDPKIPFYFLLMSLFMKIKIIKGAKAIKLIITPS